MAFKLGDKVAWSRATANMFGKGTVLKRSALASVDPTARFGRVTDLDAGTGWPEVTFEDGSRQVLTNDEVIAVET